MIVGSQVGERSCQRSKGKAWTADEFRENGYRFEKFCLQLTQGYHFFQELDLQRYDYFEKIMDNTIWLHPIQSYFPSYYCKKLLRNLGLQPLSTHSLNQSININQQKQVKSSCWINFIQLVYDHVVVCDVVLFIMNHFIPEWNCWLMVKVKYKI